MFIKRVDGIIDATGQPTELAVYHGRISAVHGAGLPVLHYHLSTQVPKLSSLIDSNTTVARTKDIH